MADNAADVAEDYRQALEDLTVNSRIEIATLTNIARENANHGFAISEALANHIKKVCPVAPAIQIDASDRLMETQKLTAQSGTTVPDTTSPVRPRFGRQECSDTLCALLWPQALFDLHGCLYQGRQWDTAENGRDAQDMEGARAGFHLDKARLPARASPAD